VKLYALLAVRNEARFIEPCLRHLIGQGCSVYLLDNESTDDTVERARPFLGRGVLGIERLPYRGVFSVDEQMARKQALARELDGDWYLHVDADEIPLPTREFPSLAAAAAAADAAGYNVINFEEFVFLPTEEQPDHDHPRYMETMRHYYFFAPRSLRLQRLWKRPSGDISLGHGHRVEVPGKSVFPRSFILKHYLALGAAHLARKYGERRWDSAHRAGPPTWRYRLDLHAVRFPPASVLSVWDERAAPDTRVRWREHWFASFRPPWSIAQSARTIVVLGMHRSGTTCLTGLLEQAGVFLGEVSKKHHVKTLGKRENRRIVRLHDDLLTASGGSWDVPPASVTWSEPFRDRRERIIERYGEAPLWGFKDPRTLLVLDGWLERLPQAELVGIFRHPLAVAQSLERRDGFTVDHGLALWTAYNERLLECRRERAFPIVSFDDASFVEGVRGVARTLDLPDVDGPFDFFQPDRRHGIPAAAAPLPPRVDALYRSLQAYQEYGRDTG
jgi:hypothetical protein